jgi:DNA-binding NarL/FixJ family response regulator
MQEARGISVVILYTHPLLGEGLAGLLAAEPDLRITHVPSCELAATESALGSAPDVVIFERNGDFGALDLLKHVPNALLIDVGIDTGPTVTYVRREIQGQPEGLLRAIRGARGSERTVLVDAASGN